ncbi:MAG: EamA family transporter [Chloroflexi bacterium]|nr:EamA family transporter [Chloroflexota bacterium]
MNRWKDWGAFWLLGLIWGSSFLWIHVAVQEIGPFMLVALRVLIGALGLALVAAVARPALPRTPRTYLAMAVLGLINTALPFVLISWGETRIPSSLASILNGTVPLFTILIAHVALHDDRITLPRVLGLAVGFAGVVVLLSKDLEPGTIHASLLGQGAVILAAVSYAGASVFARTQIRNLAPLASAMLPLIAADLFMWLALPVFESPVRFPRLPLTWVALVWLGLLGSCIAYLLYFHLIRQWGPTRSTMVTYVFPVVGLILGILFLNEHADWRLMAGSALIVAGIGVVNWRPRRAAVQSAAK